MSAAVDPTRCPLCGNSNECGMAQGAESCWCFDTTIPSDVIERVPPQARELVCVCRACANGTSQPTGVAQSEGTPPRTR